MSRSKKTPLSQPADGLAELFAAEGGCVDIDTARTLYRKPKPATRQRICNLIRDGDLIGYRTDNGEYRIPAWQFKPRRGVLHGIKEALHALRNADTFEPITPFVFFLQEDPLTDGKTPLQALREGLVGKVLFSAQHYSDS